MTLPLQGARLSAARSLLDTLLHECVADHPFYGTLSPLDDLLLPDGLCRRPSSRFAAAVKG